MNTQQEEFTCTDPPIPEDYKREWEEFFRTVHTKTKDAQRRMDALYHSNLFPLQYRGELAQMMGWACSIEPKTIMEIGCDKCAGLYNFCMIPSVTHIIGCEIRGTPFFYLFEKNFPDIDFTWCSGASRDPGIVKGIRDVLFTDSTPKKIDILFIDGDKCFYTEDFDTYLPMMNPNGLVFMHDVTEGYPKEVFENIGKRGYRTQLIRDISDYNVFVRQNRKPETPYENWLETWKGTSCGVGLIHLDGRAK